MKKLFTLTLVFLVATMGYSQVRKVSKNDAKNKVATMQATKDMESLENAQSEPNIVRWDFDYGQGELDYTVYDWQTYAGPRTWTIVWPDGKVNFAYNVAYEESLSDRGTGIGTYDSENDEWIPLGGRIETEKTSFGSIARYRDNSIVVAAQTETQCGIYIVDNKDNMAPNSVPATSYLNPTYDPSYPAVMTSGANRDIIHVVATASAADGISLNVPGAEGANMPIIYFRSTDGGLTWDKENVILPYMGSEYGVAWGPHVCYWMETTDDNCLALVVNNAWSDGMVIYSYDNGETWERKVFYHHPGINTTFDSWFMYPRWVSALWGADDELCIAYEFNGTSGEPGSDIYYPGIGGVAFWSENMPYYGETLPAWGPDPNNPKPMAPGQPFIMDSAYIFEDIYSSWYGWSQTTHGMWPEYIGYRIHEEYDTIFNIDDPTLHGDYHCGPVAMPVLAMVPDSNGSEMVAVWSAMDENNTDGTSGNFYFKLFASYTPDGGRTWTPQIQLTTDFMWSLNEFVYTQAAVIGRTLVVAVQSDGESGTFVQGDDPDPSNNYYQGFTFDLSGFLPPVPPPPPTPHYADSEWYYEITWDDGIITYQHLECTGDTTINNERPKVIVRSNTQYDRDTIFEVTHEYVYEKMGFVYWWNRELQEFTTLYDLNAEVGDEWEIMVGLESIIMHVDAVRDTVYEGRIYRILSVSDPEDLFSGDIVRGIGHLTSFFPEKLMNRGKGFRVEGLRCFWEEGDLVFKIGEEDCDAIFDELHGVEEDGPSTPLTGLGTSRTFVVYPNPTNGILFVQTLRATSLPTEQEYRITNLMGQTLLQDNLNAETQQIDISSLPAGMYFISVSEQTVKFVVQ